MNEEYFKPLTPSFRNDINLSIEKQMAELSTCSNNVFVEAQMSAFKALSNIINALPDGYPVPMKRN